MGTTTFTTNESANKEEEKRSFHRKFCIWIRSFHLRKVGHLLKLQLEISVLALLLNFLQNVSTILCGHLSVEELGAVGLATSFITVFISGIAVGLLAASMTFFTQCFSNVAYRKNMGVYFQTSLLASSMSVCVVICIFLNARLILPLLGQNLIVSEMTSRYLMVAAIGLPFDFLLLAISAYLVAQNKSLYIIVPLFAVNVLNTASQSVAIYGLGYRYLSSAICRTVSVAVVTSGLVGYMYFTNLCRDTWDGWSKMSLLLQLEYWKLGIPSIGSLLLEILSLQSGVFILGYIGTVEMDAHVIILTTVHVTFLIRFGLCTAVCITVGYELGVGNGKAAKEAFCTAMWSVLLTAPFFCISFVVLRNEIPKVFTDDPEVISEAAKAFLGFSMVPLFDGIAIGAVGVLRGIGRQLIQFLVVLVSTTVFTLPVGIPLAYLTSLKVEGLWLGYLVGFIAKASIFVAVILTIDWNVEVELAKNRYTCSNIKENGQTLSPKEDTALLSENANEKRTCCGWNKSTLFTGMVFLVFALLVVASIISYIFQHSLANLEKFFTCKSWKEMTKYANISCAPR